MKAILLMFDSLNRHLLPPYGCDWTHAPNFRRLAEKTVTFDCAYVGSMPCMPARRELHTGRYNFLHRSWGPMEPFDDSMPEALHRSGVHTHLASDHYHYWEDGGATYHTRYQTWECFRGQEGDPWIGQVEDPDIPAAVSEDARRGNPLWRQDWVNRRFIDREERYPHVQTIRAGMDFLRRNRDQDNWFLHVENFDPHEPFFAPQRFRDLYPHEYSGDHFDWPPYRKVSETPDQVRHLRYEYAALLSMCDEYLGQFLDVMDELDLWKDTMLIVNTDHGFLLGEHDCWAKCWMPFYEEVAHPPLFIWDPRCGAAGQRRRSLVQTIDIPATILDYFGRPLPADMQGRPLRETVASDAPVREGGLFGVFGGHVNVTDGRYVYMRAETGTAETGTVADSRPRESGTVPVSARKGTVPIPRGREMGTVPSPLYNYTLMPTHMRGPFSLAEMRTAQLAPPFSFTKGCPVLRINAAAPDKRPQNRFPTALYDISSDPHQERPLHDAAVEKRLTELLVSLMRASDAPKEQFERLGLA